MLWGDTAGSPARGSVLLPLSQETRLSVSSLLLGHPLEPLFQQPLHQLQLMKLFLYPCSVSAHRAVSVTRVRQSLLVGNSYGENIELQTFYSVLFLSSSLVSQWMPLQEWGPSRCSWRGRAASLQRMTGTLRLLPTCEQTPRKTP